MNPSRKLLIVDDDPSVSDWLALFADRLGYDADQVGSGEEALESFRQRRPDLVTLDVFLPGLDGVEVLKALKQIDPSVPVIMLSGHGQARTIVDAMHAGAADFLRKPFEPEELELAFERALQKKELESEVAQLREQAPRLGQEEPAFLLYTENRKMRAISEMIDHVADTDITVLIRGESGTGKELVARTLFERSSRRRGPFVKVNCAALPAGLLESELFGYEKGAFTGANQRRLGKFETANQGTIFLDEITEMHPSLQAKLLQVLQDGQFSRLGGEGDVQVDTRVIAATNVNIETAVREGKFREDLFYRLNVVTVQIPPLRERPEEIPHLTEHFLRKYAREYGKELTLASAEMLDTFRAFHWPGNVRELENLVKRMVVLGGEAPVLQELASRTAQATVQGHGGSVLIELERFLSGDAESVSLKRIGREAAQVAERRLIEKVLNRTRWNRKEAAEILQISYKALLYKMKDSGLADSA